ncbi:MAG: hypothetical protein HYY93_01700 [Planctomycetes bacterium]|nr:hypothetical protein [Planctomycetota bacterium]
MHDPRVTCCRWDDFCVWTILGASLFGTVAYVTAADPLKGFCAPRRNGNHAAVAPVHPPAPAPAAPVRADDDKPSQPIELTVWIEKPVGDATAPGQIGVMVTSKVDAPDLEVELVLPEGMQRVGGFDKWKGASLRGTPHVFMCSCCCTADGHHEVLARATIRYPNGLTFTANDSVHCDRGECKPETPEGVEKVAPDGTRIREFPAQSPR